MAVEPLLLPPEAAQPLKPAAAETSADTRDAAEAETSSALTREIPSTCAEAEGCYPDPAFAEGVCRGKFPSLPFAMFAKGTPWQRLYVKAEKVEPVNMYRGPRSDVWLHFGEEVIVLRRRGPGSGRGVQMSGPTDVDVLRWDGTCATVRQEMFVTYDTGPMSSPLIVWKYLDDAIQEGLRKNPAVERARTSERRSCRDSSPTQASPECEKAMRKLGDAIVLAVRQGIELPLPASTPAWERPEAPASRETQASLDVPTNTP